MRQVGVAKDRPGKTVGSVKLHRVPAKKQQVVISLFVFFSWSFEFFLQFLPAAKRQVKGKCRSKKKRLMGF